MLFRTLAIALSLFFSALPLHAEEAPSTAVPEAAVAAYIERYFGCRDYLADKARGQVAEAKKARKKIDSSFSFRSGKERKDAEAAADAGVVSAEVYLKDIMEHRAVMPLQNIRNGGGLLPIRGHTASCVQKIDDKSALLKVGCNYTKKSGEIDVFEETVYAEGIDARGFLDGHWLPENETVVLWLEGSKSYTTVLGATRTIMKAVPVDKKALHAAAMKRLRAENKIPAK